MPPTPLARRRAAGPILVVIVAAHHLLLWAMLPVIPTNDAVGYVALGHTPAAARPYDPYAPIAAIPPTASLPDVPAWRAHQHPAYGYPWVYLDLPEGWEADPAWVLRQTAPPLAGGPIAPIARETDIVSMPGFPLWIDLVHALSPAPQRLRVLVALNHLCVVLVAVLLWRAGIALGRPGVGWWAGLLYGLWLLPGTRAQELVSEPLFTAADTLALLCVLHAASAPSWRRWAGAGAATGLAFGVRGVAAPQVLVLVGLALALRNPVRRRAGQTIAAVAGFGAICALVLVHNGLSYDRWTFSTASGRHLYQRISTVEKRLEPDDPSARVLLDLAARPRVEGDAPHPLQAGPLDPWAESTLWPLYFMLRAQGLSVAQADALMGDAARATIRARPAAFAFRSARNLYRLMRRTERPSFERFANEQRWRESAIAWLTPYTHVAPYAWIQAQWRAFREVFPLPSPPRAIPPSVRRGWLASAARLPAGDGARTVLALAGLVMAVAWPAARCRGAALVGAWWVAVLAMPAVGQAPIARYGEPGLPCALLLACFAVAAVGGSLARRAHG